jgi:hypothetical protein
LLITLRLRVSRLRISRLRISCVVGAHLRYPTWGN